MTMKNSIKFLFKGVKIDDRTQDYINKKIASVEKLLDGPIRSEVEIDMDKKKGMFRVEVMIKTPYKLYRAEETTESIEGSIDFAENDLKTQIRKDKEKIQTLKMRGRMSIKKKLTVAKEARFRPSTNSK
jgi:ribosomal subunit interface protein